MGIKVIYMEKLWDAEQFHGVPLPEMRPVTIGRGPRRGQAGWEIFDVNCRLVEVEDGNWVLTDEKGCKVVVKDPSLFEESVEVVPELYTPHFTVLTDGREVFIDELGEMHFLTFVQRTMRRLGKLSIEDCISYFGRKK